MMAAAPAAAASRASATASSSNRRVQPSTATRPSEASTPTMIRSSKRRHTSPRKTGSRAARVPTTAQRAPASSTVSTCASSRRPPPTSTGMEMPAMRVRISAAWAGRPSKAPSRSTTCSRWAPAACHWRAIATGSSENTVSASARPWSSRTQRPPLMSTAGTISKLTLDLQAFHRSPRRASIQRSPRGFAAQLEPPRLRNHPSPRLVTLGPSTLGRPSARNPGRASSRTSSALVLHEGGEVLEEPQAPALALLRVELGGEERAPPHRRGEGDAVRARGDAQRRIRRFGIVGVDEVEVRPARDAVEEAQIAAVLDLIPAHVGDLEAGRKAAHRARDHVEPLALAELLALGKQELVAQADAEERAVAVEAGPQRFQQAERLEIAHGVVEGAVAGEHDGLGVGHHARILGDHGAHAEPAEGLLDAAEIPATIIYDGDERGHALRDSPSSTARRRCAG